jgi:hypothetical protein
VVDILTYAEVEGKEICVSNSKDAFIQSRLDLGDFDLI